MNKLTIFSSQNCNRPQSITKLGLSKVPDMFEEAPLIIMVLFEL